METEAEIADRWRYLRQLLQAQLGRFQDGSLSISTAGSDVSAAAMIRLRREIEEFDALICRSEKRQVERDAARSLPST